MGFFSTSNQGQYLFCHNKERFLSSVLMVQKSNNLVLGSYFDGNLLSKEWFEYSCQLQFDHFSTFKQNYELNILRVNCRWPYRSLPGHGMEDVDSVFVNSGGPPLPPEFWGHQNKWLFWTCFLSRIFRQTESNETDAVCNANQDFFW